MSDQFFSMTILGRTIEHLGSQMYKHRAPSLAELVANAWDAGAERCWIELGSIEDYKPENAVISIMDDGQGMTQSIIQEQYLVVGRNRRADDGGRSHGRKVMGRKGIGKLAGFGIADKITVLTWTKGMSKAIQFSMTNHELKGEPGKPHNISFPWKEVEKKPDWPVSGTRIELSALKHTTALDANGLIEMLARRFSRTTRGEMSVFVDKEQVREAKLDLLLEEPLDKGVYLEKELESGKIIIIINRTVPGTKGTGNGPDKDKRGSPQSGDRLTKKR